MSRGYTLVEVVVSMLLMSIMVSSVFSLALSARQSGGKSDRRMEASQAAKQMTGLLRNYVTGDPATTLIDGPNAKNPANRWSLSDSTVSPPIVETCTAGACVPAGYALAPGSHTVTGVLPGWFAGPPYNAELKYYVGTETIDGLPAPQINVWVDWTEP
jgi:prepilin-type N-terminal cleavage/methylation domain-containing protein